MIARTLHLHAVDGHAIGIFDQADSIVAEVNGPSGMTEQDARRVVASWNALAHLTVEQIEAIAAGVARLDGAA